MLMPIALTVLLREHLFEAPSSGYDVKCTYDNIIWYYGTSESILSTLANCTALNSSLL